MSNTQLPTVKFSTAPQFNGTIAMQEAVVTLPDGRTCPCFVTIMSTSNMADRKPGAVKKDGSISTFDGAIGGSNGFKDFNGYGVSLTILKNRNSNNKSLADQFI